MLPITTNFEVTRTETGYSIDYETATQSGELNLTDDEAMELHLLLGHQLAEKLLDNCY